MAGGSLARLERLVVLGACLDSMLGEPQSS